MTTGAVEVTSKDEKGYGYCPSPMPEKQPPSDEQKKKVRRNLFNSRSNTSDSISSMGKGLAAAGILVIVWIFLKDPLVKLISSIKEKYGKS